MELVIGSAQPDSTHVYDLCNMIIHVGSGAEFGHYHAFVR